MIRLQFSLTKQAHNLQKKRGYPLCSGILENDRFHFFARCYLKLTSIKLCILSVNFTCPRKPVTTTAPVNKNKGPVINVVAADPAIFESHFPCPTLILIVASEKSSIITVVALEPPPNVNLLSFLT